MSCAIRQTLNNNTYLHQGDLPNKSILLEKIFNTLIDSFIESEVGIVNNFLSVQLAKNLRNNLLRLYENQLMFIAGTGNEKLVVHNTNVRNDRIHWLDRKHHDVHENAFFDVMDRFIVHLNRTCYTGITDYEFHYTIYESGSFYKKHIDQFQQNGKSVFFKSNQLAHEVLHTNAPRMSITGWLRI